MANLKEKSINAVIWNLLERYGNQFVSLIIGVILARILTPADYGLIGMITVFFALAMVFVNSGFGSAYIQKKDANEDDASTIFFFNIGLSSFFYIIFWLLAPLIANFYNQIELINLIRVSSVILIINSFSIIQIAKLTKDVNFKKKSILSLVSTIISGVLGILAALFGYGVWSLVIQQVSSTLLNAIGLWSFYSWRPRMVFNIESLKSMFSFGSWVLLTDLIFTIFRNIYILVIGKFFPVAILGFYTKAKGFRDMVSQQPISAISAVSFPVLSKSQDDKVASKNMMKKFMTHALFLIAFMSVFLIVLAKPLILIVLTEKWLPMVPYFQLLMIIGFFYPMNLFNAQLLMAQGKSRINFNLSIIKNLLTLLNIVIMYRFGVIFIIYGQVFLSFVALFINSIYSKEYINYGTFEQLKDIFSTLLISLVIIISGILFLELIFSNYLKIIVGGVFTIGSYILLQFVFNKKLLMSNIDIIKAKFNLKKQVAI